jgi:hypothetical protein
LAHDESVALTETDDESYQSRLAHDQWLYSQFSGDSDYGYFVGTFCRGLSILYGPLFSAALRF